MKPLVDLISDYVAKHRHSLAQTYDWPIPAGWPACKFERGSDSLATANQRLRICLSTAWHDYPNARAEIERWYVSDWGGVRANRDKTLARYSAISNKELQRQPTGVASWSKILSIRDPDRYAIFDARVAASINALQICNKALTWRFPNIPSRNNQIVCYKKFENVSYGEIAPIRYNVAYPTFLNLIRKVCSRLGLRSHHIVEMTLFANAVTLTNEAMRHHRIQMDCH